MAGEPVQICGPPVPKPAPCVWLRLSSADGVGQSMAPLNGPEYDLAMWTRKAHLQAQVQEGLVTQNTTVMPSIEVWRARNRQAPNRVPIGAHHVHFLGLLVVSRCSLHRELL